MEKKSKSIIRKSCFIIPLVAIIISLIVFSMRKTVSVHKEAVIEQYIAKYDYILDGYSKAVTYFLENYHTNLKLLYDNATYHYSSEEAIFAFLAEKQTQAHPDFLRLFYTNNNKIVYFSDGTKMDFNSRVEQFNSFTSDDAFAIGPVFKAGPNNLFLVYIPIYNSRTNSVIGFFGATIKAEKISEIISSLNLYDGSKISLIDQMGQFIYHNNTALIGQTFTPKDSEYSKFSTTYITSQSNGHTVTQDLNENKIDLFYHQVPLSNWSMLISVPANRKEELSSRFNKLNLMLIVCTIVGVLVIFLQIGYQIYSLYAIRLKSISIDPLTNLWTRSHFEKTAQRMIDRSPRSKFMLIECDIRGFKFINQNYGGEIADQVILFFSKVLEENTKDFNGIIGRGFADHFYFFAKISSVYKAMGEFKKKNIEISDSIKNYDISFFPKFGIAFLMNREEDKNVTIHELIGQASFAKSTIKDNMLTQFAIYNSKLLKTVNNERFIESNMESALQNNEFFVMYQPKIDLLTDSIVGAEALVRWNSPKLGVVYPDEFIPLFERNGFIKKLDFYVYKKVFTFIQSQLNANAKIVPISVNMSRSHSKPDKFMHDFLNIFHEFNIPPKMVEVEILERSFMNGNTLKEFTELLHREGFTVAMDDFGSGESSLNMLTQIPVDVLKFDRTFLYSSTTEGDLDPASANFIETLIELGKNLKKQTIFEGVETQAQIDFLRSVECDQAQGYFFSRPLTENDFIEYIKEH